VIWEGGCLRRLALAVCIAYGAALGAEMAAAVELPPGSRNFTAPNHVPSYFSNETAPFRGTSGGQTASPGAGPVVAVPGSAERGTVASNRLARQKSVQAGRQRARLARGKAGRHGHVARARVSRGGKAIAGRGASVKKASAAVGRAAPARVQGGKARGGKSPGGKAQRVARARG
jgi:hypothetical protein